MPTPHIFQSREHLVQALQAQTTAALARSFFATRTATISRVAREGVSGNTFRAFRNLPVRPSYAFRTWVARRIERTLPSVLQATDGTSYAAYVHSTTQTLNRYWRKRTKSEMGYGRGAKLLNLVLKKLACYTELTEVQRNTLIALLHVPLDSYTIVGLRTVASHLNIPKSATMKFITTPEQYRQFQSLVGEIAAEARVPPIYYDILAWDMAH